MTTTATRTPAPAQASSAHAATAADTAVETPMAEATTETGVPGAAMPSADGTARAPATGRGDASAAHMPPPASAAGGADTPKPASGTGSPAAAYDGTTDASGPPAASPLPATPMPAPSTPATLRLAASRTRLRMWLLDPDAAEEAERPAPPPGHRARRPGVYGRLLRRHPELRVVVEALEAWWKFHPVHRMYNVAEQGAKAVIVPVVRKHPVATIATAAVIGVAVVGFRPWRNEHVRRSAKTLPMDGGRWVMRQLASLPLTTMLSTFATFVAMQAKKNDAERPAGVPNPTPVDPGQADPVATAAPTPPGDTASRASQSGPTTRSAASGSYSQMQAMAADLSEDHAPYSPWTPDATPAPSSRTVMH